LQRNTQPHIIKKIEYIVFCHLFSDPSGENKENITELLVAEGLVELRRMGLRTEE